MCQMYQLPKELSEPSAGSRRAWVAARGKGVVTATKSPILAQWDWDVASMTQMPKTQASVPRSGATGPGCNKHDINAKDSSQAGQGLAQQGWDVTSMT